MTKYRVIINDYRVCVNEIIGFMQKKIRWVDGLVKQGHRKNYALPSGVDWFWN